MKDLFSGWMAWLGLGGIAAVVIALVVMNPVAALRLVKAIGGFFIDAARWFFEWLRKPGSWIKLVIGALALWAAIASLNAYQKGQTIVVITKQHETELAAKDLRIGELVTATEAYRKQEQDFARIARKNTERLDAARKQSEAALAEIATLQAKAEASSAGWRREYAKRPDTCKAALEALDTACPAIGGY